MWLSNLCRWALSYPAPSDPYLCTPTSEYMWPVFTCYCSLWARMSKLCQRVLANAQRACSLRALWVDESVRHNITPYLCVHVTIESVPMDALIPRSIWPLPITMHPYLWIHVTSVHVLLQPLSSDVEIVSVRSRKCPAHACTSRDVGSPWCHFDLRVLRSLEAMPMDAFKKGVPGLCEAIGKTEERYLCSVSPYCI